MTSTTFTTASQPSTNHLVQGKKLHSRYHDTIQPVMPAAFNSQFIKTNCNTLHTNAARTAVEIYHSSVLLNGWLPPTPKIDPSEDSGVDAWVIVYSVADRSSFSVAASLLGKLWTSGQTSCRAVILVANKTDLERTRAVTTAEGRTLARTYACKFIEVSAGLDHNVDELLVGILAQLACKFIEVSAGLDHNVDELLVGILAQIRLKSCSQLSHRSHSRSAIAARLVRKLSGRMSGGKAVRMTGLVGKLLNRDRKAKSCENLHIL
ncbi:GTP-binding protein REM 1-like [Hyalella azteca]|uniref:GTP-binding protein REM 1-like n=1 Tax=Hyalella azteca TaxID=294128 RepID=A0A8B7NJB9_HYAAZ|nr:GTP-binding protein REM 1-like [Hyalella azteca]